MRSTQPNLLTEGKASPKLSRHCLLKSPVVVAKYSKRQNGLQLRSILGWVVAVHKGFLIAGLSVFIGLIIWDMIFHKKYERGVYEIIKNPPEDRQTYRLGALMCVGISLVWEWIPVRGGTGIKGW